MCSPVEAPVPVVIFVNFSFLVFDVSQMKQSVVILNVNVSVHRNHVGPLLAMSLAVALGPGSFRMYFRLLADIYQALHFVWYLTVIVQFIM